MFDYSKVLEAAITDEQRAILMNHGYHHPVKPSIGTCLCRGFSSL